MHLENVPRMKFQLFSILTVLAFSFTGTFAVDALDEKAFQKHMKAVGKANKEFKGNFEARNAVAIEKDAGIVAVSYEAMAAYFKARKTTDATKWSDDSAAAARTTAVAAKAGDWDKVKSSWGALGKNCKDCHDKYREKLPDGGYKIK